MTKNTIKLNALTLFSMSVLGLSLSPTAQAQIDMAQQPVLVITNKTMQPTNTAPIYSSPSRAPEITADQVSNAAYNGQGASMIGGKIEGLNRDFLALQSNIGRLAEQLNSITSRGKNISAGYYASVATINTALQTGTTPGNPRLLAQLDTAEKNLNTLSSNVASLNALGTEIADSASKASYLLDNIRATFSVTGAVEEDHARLAQMEDQVNTTTVAVNRLLNEVNDNISRSTSYLATEHNNLRTLSLAVMNGDLYGNSLANNPFSRAPQSDLYEPAGFAAGGYAAPSVSPMAQPAVMAPSTPAMPTRPLAKIRFDKPNVNYQQPVYNAIQDAMQRYPNARFELIAVHPTAGNAAQMAIESTRARRNAEDVLRTLTQMGVPMDKIDLSNSSSAEARTNEVHLFIR